MKWIKEDIDIAKKLLDNGVSYFKIGQQLDRTAKSVKVKLNKLGYGVNHELFYVDKKCACCGNNFKSLKSHEQIYCSRSCSAIINNQKFFKRKKINFVDDSGNFDKLKYDAYNENKPKCLVCGKTTKDKFCSKKCESEYKREEIFKNIENGDLSYTHRQYKKYMINKFGEKCMECGWEERNPVTKNVPIELEHIDGNSDNNSLENLKLLCPNCHSLTPTYKALNVGNGRHSRRERYKEGKSY